MSFFVLNSLPDNATEGRLYQSADGVDPAGSALSTVPTTITHVTGAFVFERATSLLDAPVDIVVLAYSNATHVLSTDTVRVFVQTTCATVHRLQPAWASTEVQPPAPSNVAIEYDDAQRLFSLTVELP